MKDIIVISVVRPRYQHLAWLAGLYSVRDSIEKLYILGELIDRREAKLLLKELNCHFPIFYAEREISLGEARAWSIANVAEEFGIPENFSPDVLFLDDDVVLAPDVLDRLVSLRQPGVGVIGYQSTMMNVVELIRGRPAFDFFCTLVPYQYVFFFAQDFEAMRLLERLKWAESFLLDWWLREKGLMFNILSTGVLHLWSDDYEEGYLKGAGKEWAKWSDEKWDKLYREIYAAKSLQEVESIFDSYGIIIKKEKKEEKKK